jgi:kinesin family protein 11
MADHLETANKRVKTSEEEYVAAQQVYGEGMDAWNGSSQALIEQSVQSRESIKARLKGDWASANDHTGKITETTNAVYGETVRIVDDQMAQMDNQLVALDEIVARVKAQNEEHHKAHTSSLAQLAGNVQESYQSIGKHFETSYDRTKALDVDMQDHTATIQATLPTLEADGDIREPLRLMREELTAAQIAEYQATGETPAKTHYAYPNQLPRTEDRDNLLDRFRGGTGAVKRPASPVKSPNKRSPRKMMRTSPTKAFAASSSPTKQHVFADTPPVLKFTQQQQQPASAPATRPQSSHSNPGTLREVDINVANAGVAASNITIDSEQDDSVDSKPTVSEIPPLKRQLTHPIPSQVFGGESKLPTKRRTVAGLPIEGRENIPAPTTRRLRPRSGD